MKTNFKHLFSAVAFFCLLLAAASANAQTIATSDSDFSPGNTITFNGSGFGAEEAVSLQVINVSTNIPEENTPAWVVSTDGSGNWQATWTVPSAVTASGFKLTANARASASWSIYYLDGVTPAEGGQN
jgi:hypothetical protein